MRHQFEITATDTPGLLARVESIFRRQRTPIRSFFFEKGDGASAVLAIEADAEAEKADLLRKQLIRLLDVTEVREAAGTRAFAPPESQFTFKEKTA